MGSKDREDFQEENPSYQKKFTNRMRYEGRYDDFRAEIQKHQDNGDRWADARRKAMKTFGYVSAEEENTFYEERKAEWYMNEERQTQTYQDEADREQAFMSAFDALPEVSSGNQDVDWVACHPKMMEKPRHAKSRIVKVGVEDIEDAPSKVAVTTLMANVENPKAFFDKYHDGKFNKVKGGGSAGAGSAIEADLDPDNLDDMKDINAYRKVFNLPAAEAET